MDVETLGTIASTSTTSSVPSPQGGMPLAHMLWYVGASLSVAVVFWLACASVFIVRVEDAKQGGIRKSAHRVWQCDQKESICAQPPDASGPALPCDPIFIGNFLSPLSSTLLDLTVE